MGDRFFGLPPGYNGSMDKNTDVKQLRASLAAACMGRWGTGLDVLDIEEATDEDIIEMAKGRWLSAEQETEASVLKPMAQPVESG